MGEVDLIIKNPCATDKTIHQRHHITAPLTLQAVVEVFLGDAAQGPSARSNQDQMGREENGGLWAEGTTYAKAL